MRSRLIAICITSVVLLASGLTSAAAAPSVLPAPTVSPTRVLPGGSFTVRGTHCPTFSEHLPSTFEVSIRARKGDGFGAGGTTNHGGTWQIGLRVPADFPAGTYPVRTTCKIDGVDAIPYDDASLTVVAAAQPQVVLSASTVTAGDRLTLEASGFGAREHVNVRLRTVGLLTVATTDPNGAVAAEVTVPSTTPAGRQHVDVIAVDGTKASAPVTVLAPPGRCEGTSCEPTSPPLATTGVSTVQLLLLGLAMMAIGAAMMTAGLRRAD